MKALFLVLLLLLAPSTQAFEMAGILGYDFNLMRGKPINTVASGGGVTYGFFGRLDLSDASKIESGFLYAPTSLTTHYSFGDVKSSGSYWLIPLLYRFDLMAPFFSLALGLDYAVVGTNSISINGTIPASSYQSHLGAEVSFQAVQDLGENLGALFDLRYRQGLQDAISFGTQGTQFNFLLVALGLQKRLE